MFPWYAFLTYAVITAATPGPNNIMSMSNAGRLDAQPHLRGTEEYVTVFQGPVEIGVDGEVYRLKTGDSIRFPGDVPHQYINAGELPAQLSMLIYYHPV